MASNYTANYGLCQWEATDNFVRTEFNQDNARIDAAIKGVADTAAAETAALAERVTAADRGLTNLTYNVYDMAMKSYYENKVSGQRRAMFVEDFETEDYVAELDEETAAVLNPSKEELSRCQMFVNLPKETLELYDELWVLLKS